jgi:hypothetical protein
VWLAGAGCSKTGCRVSKINVYTIIIVVSVHVKDVDGTCYFS